MELNRTGSFGSYRHHIASVQSSSAMDPNVPQTPAAGLDEVDLEIGFRVRRWEKKANGARKARLTCDQLLLHRLAATTARAPSTVGKQYLQRCSGAGLSTR